MARVYSAKPQFSGVREMKEGMPTTIEVLRDVTVGRGPHERTRLTVFGADSDEFVIRYTGSEHFCWVC